MPENATDIAVIRELARKYAEIAAEPLQDERRELWRMKNSMESCRTLIHVRFGFWNAWCRELFADERLSCADPFWRDVERKLRILLFHADLRDDTPMEPWLTSDAVHVHHPDGTWGLQYEMERSESDGGGGAGRYDPPIKDFAADLPRMKRPLHRIDEVATERRAGRLREAVDGIIEVDVRRMPSLHTWLAEISTELGKLRGIEQIMIDMYEDPEGLKRLVTFMRDSILAVQEEAERAGDFSATAGFNQSAPYSRELGDPRPNAGPRKRKQLWGYAAAQEFTLVSPEMHEEFLLAFQKPIMEHYGLSAYGCCEDLSRKIKMLRQVKNLRRIAVAPSADAAECARQIGTDYVMSWRPNPTDLFCGAFSEDKVRKIIRTGLEGTRGCHVEIGLKDIENVEGDPGRIKRCVRIAREEAERLY